MIIFGIFPDKYISICMWHVQHCCVLIPYFLYCIYIQPTCTIGSQTPSYFLVFRSNIYFLFRTFVHHNLISYFHYFFSQHILRLFCFMYCTPHIRLIFPTTFFLLHFIISRMQRIQYGSIPTVNNNHKNIQYNYQIYLVSIIHFPFV